LVVCVVWWGVCGVVCGGGWGGGGGGGGGGGWVGVGGGGGAGGGAPAPGAGGGGGGGGPPPPLPPLSLCDSIPPLALSVCVVEVRLTCQKRSPFLGSFHICRSFFTYIGLF